ncbi:MAG: LysR family transcriptional regulator [Candidatus Carbobacillus sp.]|nr:LysR family transcriptional regulator [Candidatus Carbobacillus sp.]
MNIDHLKTFVTVAKTQSFSRAAELLNLSQPAVSHHIRALESHFSQALFERQPRQVILTPFGKKLMPHAEALLDMYYNMEAFALKNDEGPLHISTSNTIGEYMLFDLIKAFVEKEGIRFDQIQPHVSTTENALLQVEKGVAHIALVEGRVPEGPFTYAVFAQDEMIPVIRHDLQNTHPIRKGPWVMRENGCTMRSHTESYIEQLGLSMDDLEIIVFNNNRLVKQGVLKGLGVGLLPLRSVQEELAEGSLVRLPLTPPAYYRPLYMVRLKGAFPSRIARLFWDTLLNKEGDYR